MKATRTAGETSPSASSMCAEGRRPPATSGARHDAFAGLKGAVMTLEVMKKLPLGGVDRRAMVGALAEKGPGVARELLAKQKSAVRSQGTNIPKDVAVVILGGSNGITRGLAVQLLFGERASVFGVHVDSEKMQIGPHHVAAITEAAAAEGLTARFFNADATKPETIQMVIAELKPKFRAVHLVNGIAAGATKRYKEHGPTQVKELDVAW